MATIAEIKRELQTYIAQAIEIENANKFLKERVTLLERDLRVQQMVLVQERESFQSRLKTAKESWREQAIDHGRKQRDEAYQECDESVQEFKRLFLDKSSNRTSSLVSSLIRSKFHENHDRSQSRIYAALAHAATKLDTLIVCDFDIVDKHVLLRNKSASEIPLAHYSLRLAHTGHVFRFAEGSTLPARSTVSLWWGKRNQFRHAPNKSSFVWPSNEFVSADSHEIVEVVDRSGRVVFAVSTNQQADSLLLKQQAASASHGSERTRGKRKQEDLSALFSSPPPKRSTNALATSWAVASSSGVSSTATAAAAGRPADDDDAGYATTVEAISLVDHPFGDAVTTISGSGSSNSNNNGNNAVSSGRTWEATFLMPMPKPLLRERHAGPVSIVSIELVSRPLSSTPTNQPPKFSTEDSTGLTHSSSSLPKAMNHSSEVDFKDVVITMVNESKEPFALTGCRFLVVGYPSLSFEMPLGAVLDARSSIVFCSKPEVESTDAVTDSETSSPDDHDKSVTTSAADATSATDAAAATTNATDDDDGNESEVPSESRAPGDEEPRRWSITTRHSSKVNLLRNSLVTRSGAKYMHNGSSSSGIDGHGSRSSLTLDDSGNGDSSSSSSNKSATLPSSTVVIPDLASMAKFFPYPRSLHFIDSYGQNVCEFVESGNLSGIFGVTKASTPFGRAQPPVLQLAVNAAATTTTTAETETSSSCIIC